MPNRGLVVLLPDGREAPVEVTLLSWDFDGVRPFLACPERGRAVTVPGHAPTTNAGLACCADSKTIVKELKHRSQGVRSCAMPEQPVAIGRSCQPGSSGSAGGSRSGTHVGADLREPRLRLLDAAPPRSRPAARARP